MHIWRTYVHMCTKYEVSMSNHVPEGGVQMMMMMTTMPPVQDDANNDDRQSMIV